MELNRIGSISFDMDGWWALLDLIKEYPPRERDFVIERSIPRLLRLLKVNGIKATFFVLGPDVESMPELFRCLVLEGHEIGNHTYSHFHHLKSMPEKEIYEEVKRTHDIIKDRLKVTPVGFRAPGYSFNEKVLAAVERTGYLYDSSVVPFCFPGMTPPEWMLAQSKPYHPSPMNILKKGSSKLLEIPLSAHPIVRMPMLGTGIRLLGQWYLWTAMPFSGFLNINLHARDAVPELPFNKRLPGMVYHRVSECMEITSMLLSTLGKKMSMMTLEQYYTHITENK